MNNDICRVEADTRGYHAAMRDVSDQAEKDRANWIEERKEELLSSPGTLFEAIGDMNEEHPLVKIVALEASKSKPDLTGIGRFLILRINEYAQGLAEYEHLQKRGF